MVMHFFDAHIHLSDFENVTPKALIDRLKSAGVSKCVCVSAHRHDWAKVAQFAHNFPFEVVPAFGLHPWYIDEATDGWTDELEEYLDKFPECAIGECGFDKLRRTDFEKEKKIFEMQLELANVRNRPLIIHAVKADEEMQKYDAFLPERTVFHSFSGSGKILNEVINLRFYVSINKRFFSRNNAEDTLKKIPFSKLLLETDAPYQSDVEDLGYIVSQIASLKGENADKVAEKLYLNAMDIFGE